MASEIKLHDREQVTVTHDLCLRHMSCKHMQLGPCHINCLWMQQAIQATCPSSTFAGGLQSLREVEDNVHDWLKTVHLNTSETKWIHTVYLFMDSAAINCLF